MQSHARRCLTCGVVDCKAHPKSRLAGVLYDHGTGKRIPFATWYDAKTGEYECIVATADGCDYLVDEDYRPIMRRGRAVGKLELLPNVKAKVLGVAPPKKVVSDVIPAGAREDGFEQYKHAYFKVWGWRGDSRRCAADRFDDYVRKIKADSFLDVFVIKRRSIAVRSLLT